MKTKITSILLTAAAALLLQISAQAALNWEGQSGVFLNSLAYPLAPSVTEASAHWVDLDKLGSVSTYNITTGLKENVEIGYTRYASNVNGVKNQNNLHVKWQFAKETKEAPAIALWALHRSLQGSDNDTEFGLTVTKVFQVEKHAVIVDLGARSTKSLGLGLFGVGDERKTRLEGALGIFVTPKFILATEFKQQVNARAWTDIAARYIVNDNLNLDAGIANFAEGIDSQLALAATYKL